MAKNFALSVDERRSIVGQIGIGLGDLFAAGLIHGDLTPKNIMVDRNGRVVLLDFGLPTLAKGTIVGAFDYMSDARKNGNAPSKEDDLFALDLIAFDLENSLIGQKKPPRNLLSIPSLGKTFGSTSVKAPASLRTKVNQLLEGREDGIRTRVFSENYDFRFLRLVNLLIILALVPGTQASNRGREAWLAVRSLNWVEVQVGDGRTVSSNQDRLRISSGKHLLKWRTAKKTGILSFEVTENQDLVLRDSDFN